MTDAPLLPTLYHQHDTTTNKTSIEFGAQHRQLHLCNFALPLFALVFVLLLHSGALEPREFLKKLSGA